MVHVYQSASNLHHGNVHSSAGADVCVDTVSPCCVRTACVDLPPTPAGQLHVAGGPGQGCFLRLEPERIETAERYLLYDDRTFPLPADVHITSVRHATIMTNID